MREGYWVIRTYTAGHVGEKTKYFVPGKRPDRIRRQDRRIASRAEKNNTQATKTLARLLNANFGEQGGVLLGLDYNPEAMEKILQWGRENGLPVDDEEEDIRQGAIWEAADHAMGIALRRVKRILAKKEKELKAVYITSNMDEQTQEYTRVHHHLVVQEEALPAFMEAWEKYGMGSVDYERLWNKQADRTPLAEYFMRQVRRVPDAKKYRSTRNLIRPKPKDQIAKTDAEIRPPKGSELVYRQEFRKGGDQYIRYLIVEDKKKRKEKSINESGGRSGSGQEAGNILCGI